MWEIDCSFVLVRETLVFQCTIGEYLQHWGISPTIGNYHMFPLGFSTQRSEKGCVHLVNFDPQAVDRDSAAILNAFKVSWQYSWLEFSS